MKIYDCAQGETDWLDARLGKVTASEASQLMTPEFSARTGEMPQTYLAKKIAETLLGRPLEGFSTFATENGEMMEMEARAWFAFEHDHKVTQVGFVEHDDGRCGCSPDALLDDDGGLEIKSPQPTNHVKYLLGGVLPKDYAVQVHFSMYVTGRPTWTFVSYRRKLPPLVLKIDRDEKIMQSIAAILENFYSKYDQSLLKIKNQTK